MSRTTLRSGWALVASATVAVGACASSPVASSAGPAAATSAVPSVTAGATRLAPTARPRPSAPVVRAGEPWIAFERFAPGADVVLVRPDGSDLHSPTRDVRGGDRTNPDWSPDGSMLVFAVNDAGRDVLWVVNADGTGARRLVDCEGDCRWLDDPAWSPDGRSVLFTRGVTADGQSVGTLEQVDVASGAVELIETAAPKHFYAGARWSPDGKSVVLEVVEVASKSFDSDIADVSLAIIDLAAPTPAGRSLTKPGTFPETAAWARDGSRIVFGAFDAPGATGDDLFEMRPDGTGLRRITTLAKEGGNATHPDVSADGKSVVFAAQLPGETRTVLGLMDFADGDVRSATGATYIDGVHPRLRPVP